MSTSSHSNGQILKMAMINKGSNSQGVVLDLIDLNCCFDLWEVVLIPVRIYFEK